jgi:hypothetical protein
MPFNLRGNDPVMLKIASTLAVLIIVVNTACSTPDEVEQSVEQSCDSQSETYLRDECFHNQLLASGASEIEAVIALANSIEDPIIRGAAIFRWIELHNREIPRERGRALCEILSEREKTSCERRLYSAHLQR